MAFSLSDHSVVVGALCRPGTLVDVGANFGQFSELLLQTEGSRVVAFEAVTETFVAMCHNISCRYSAKLPPHFSAHKLAIGAELGLARISIPYFGGTRWEGRASIVHDFAALAEVTKTVEITHVEQETLTVPLDFFAFDQVTFLKIDVEGFEQEVLNGARETIARHRPIIHIEIEEQHRAGALTTVPKILDELGYRGFFELRGQVANFEAFDPATMQKAPPLPRTGLPYPEIYVFEFIFVHREDTWGLQRIAILASLAQNV